MRIRTILLIAFLTVTIFPTAIFGWWSYSHAVKREFAEVEDRHLLLAQNLSAALTRYHTDLVGTLKTVSSALLSDQTTDLQPLMSELDIVNVFLVDQPSVTVIAQMDAGNGSDIELLTEEHLALAKRIAQPGETKFSHVVGTQTHGNVLLGVRSNADNLTIAFVSTQYFKQLGEQISFGKNGHAAIVDNAGNVLSHPVPDWVESRRNLSQISAVARMMSGETGIDQFYSPAFKGDMIAGLTSVEGPGWGVMIPQPVEEIYEKVRENSISIVLALAIGWSMAAVFVLLFVNSLIRPLEQLLQSIKENAREKKLNPVRVRLGLVPLREVWQLKLGYNAMVGRVAQANEKVSAMAFSDDVTGLANRKRFEEVTRGLLAGCETEAARGIVAFIDLDDFKQINDVHGHSYGDRFLRERAAKLTELVQAAEQTFFGDEIVEHPPIAARVGGDEFVIVFPGLSREDDIRQFLVQVRKVLSTPSTVLSEVPFCAASIGCARYPEDSTNLDGLLKCADIAMYHAKKAGKNRFEMYSSQMGMMTAAELCVAVDQAIDDNQLVLEYQPKVCARTKEPRGVEALVRWNHPVLGRLLPDNWIPIISHSPVMEKLGEWLIARAIDDHAEWTRAGLNLSVAVNISAGHFSSPGFTNSITRMARSRNFDCNNMEIEITEDTLFSSLVHANDVLESLRAEGFRVSIDDFGTGYSNIARLSQMRVDFLKIDRSVISQAHDDERVASMMDCIVLMAKTLGCKTVAEGVETQSEVDFLARHKIDILQGFYFSKGLSVSQLLAWSREHSQAVAAGAFDRQTSHAA
ncbi:EAL domain-containing protein [Pararhizobium sp. IMCC21322]|uniref:bifunctional diguanylate cyclase/phosphodiesterase n=1 Tax=Pararhizobium sp. IMCC21322 TaxID=3067903 RepID=UPI0027427E55|nr:EAL domain-containing protein [Pararhizobium sp. IMCC21322]